MSKRRQEDAEWIPLAHDTCHIFTRAYTVNALFVRATLNSQVCASRAETFVTAFIKKQNRTFLDPKFDGETDGGLKFSVQTRLAANLAIANLQLPGGSMCRIEMGCCSSGYLWMQSLPLAVARAAPAPAISYVFQITHRLITTVGLKIFFV